jgi:hypothetical protein
LFVMLLNVFRSRVRLTVTLVLVFRMSLTPILILPWDSCSFWFCSSHPTSSTGCVRASKSSAWGYTSLGPSPRRPHPPRPSWES